MNTYLLMKSLHIIAVVTWFAGLFYMPRLMIYFAEANSKPSPEKEILQNQFKIMQKRLWNIITWPSAILAPTFAGYMLMSWNVHENIWLRIKLWLVVGLYLFQFFLHKIYKEQQKGIVSLSPTKLRILNEVSTLFLVSIVFLVVMKTELALAYGVGGLIVLMIILGISISIYKRVRDNSRNQA
jgi:putative membrane protein